MALQYNLDTPKCKCELIPFRLGQVCTSCNLGWCERCKTKRELISIKNRKVCTSCAIISPHDEEPELILDLVYHNYKYYMGDKPHGVLLQNTQNKVLQWEFARFIPRHIGTGSNDIRWKVMMRRLFSISVSIHSLTHLIQNEIQTIVSISRGVDGKCEQSPEKEVLMARREIEVVAGLSLGHRIGNPDQKVQNSKESIAESIRLLSKKMNWDTPEHHPCHLHKNKLDSIRTTLIKVLSDIVEICNKHLGDIAKKATENQRIY